MRKRIAVGILMAAMLVVASPSHVAHAASQDTIVDQVGDWFATVGKSGMDKDTILAKRKAERTAERAEKGLKKAGKDMEKGINNLGR